MQKSNFNLNRFKFFIFFFHTAFASSSLYFTCQMLRGFKIDWIYSIIVFSATLSVYNLCYLKSNLSNFRIGVFAFSFFITLVLVLNHKDFFFDNKYSFGLLLLLVTLYLIPNKKINLREVPYLKSFIVSFIWALTSTLDSSFCNRITQIVFLFAFSMIFSLIIPYDMRDSKVDNIKTIPQKIGHGSSAVIAMFFSFMSTLILAVITQNFFLSFCCGALFLMLLSFSLKYYQNMNYLIVLELAIVLQSIVIYFCLY